MILLKDMTCLWTVSVNRPGLKTLNRISMENIGSPLLKFNARL